jgi:hypothetical protein
LESGRRDQCSKRHPAQSAAEERKLDQLERRRSQSLAETGTLGLLRICNGTHAGRKSGIGWVFSMANDLTYFQRRASQEKAAAFRAVDLRARQAHLAMAQKCERLIRSSAATAPKLETHLASVD